MKNDFKWQHIEFINGSNPYICKTEKDFKRLKEKYILDPIKDNFWKATFLIKYLVVGFPDKHKRATLSKYYKTKHGAMNFISNALSQNNYELLMLRKEEIYLKNTDDLCIGTSTVVAEYGR